MFIPESYTDAQIDLAILPDAVYDDVLARNLAAVRSYIIANPSMIQQFAFLNRAIRSAYTYIGKGGCGNRYNLTYLSKYSANNGGTLITMTAQQMYLMYRYLANARMNQSHMAYLMNVAFGIANQLQTAKRTILRNGQVCVNCELLPMIQNPQQLATNDSARVLNFIIENKGSTCVSGDLYNLDCGGSGQAI